MHGLNAVHRVAPILHGRIKTIPPPQPLEKQWSRSFPDAHGSVPLDIAMAAHRTNASSWSADVAPQQEEVHHFTNGRDRILVLRQAHRPATDDASGVQHDFGRFANLVPREPAA